MKTTTKKVQQLDAADIMRNYKYWTRSEMPNDTPFFAHGHVFGNGDDVVSGPVYFPLPGCDTKEKAEKMVEDLIYEVSEDLAYLGGILDFLKLKKNSKFKAKK